MSDLHLEFYPGTPPSAKLPGGDLLILAGDIITANLPRHNWFETISKKYTDIVYVLGNHEFYHGDITQTRLNIKAFVPDNFHVLENEVFEVDGLRVLGTTMWSDFEKDNPNSILNVGAGMNDFRIIQNGSFTFTPQTAYTMFQEAQAFLSTNIKTGDIVVTHHAPSFASIANRYRESALNGGFASDVSELILDTKPSCWIHGHIHTTNNYMIGNTAIVSNARGYYPSEMNSQFDWEASIYREANAA